MPLPLINIGVRGVSLVLYKIAERKKWLPKSFYHQKALEKLADGQLDEAIHYNQISLQKDPAYEKAFVIQDVINMRLDSRANFLQKNIDNEIEKLTDSQHKRVKLDHLIKKRDFEHRLHKNSLLIAFVFSLILVIFYFIFLALTWILITAGLLFLGTFLIKMLLINPKMIRDSVQLSDFLFQRDQLDDKIRMSEQKIESFTNRLTDLRK